MSAAKILLLLRNAADRLGLWWHASRAVRLYLTAGPVAEKVNQTCKCCYIHKVQKESDMALILTDEQQVVLKLSPKTAKGNPAKIDGLPTWSSSDPTVLTVTADAADATGMTALAVAVGPLGTAQAQASADADLGAGVRTITSVLDIEVQAAEAVTLTIDAGTPTVQP